MCRTVRGCLHPDTLTPDELGHAHRSLLELPAGMQPAIGCTTAFAHIKQAAEAILDLERHIGYADWPVSPQEVARRKIRSFTFQKRWELHVYQNGSREDVRMTMDHADCMLTFQSGAWAWSVHPSEKCAWVSGRSGADEESIQDAYGRISVRLQEMTESERRAAYQRRTDDINKPRATA